MIFNKSMKKVEKYIPIVLWMYILNKQLWDWMTCGVSKIVFYLLLLIGAGFGIVMLWREKRFRGIPISFGIYSIIIVLNGIVFSNAEQFKVGIKSYLLYPIALFALVYYMKDIKNLQYSFKPMIYWGSITSVLAIVEFALGQSVLPGYIGRTYTFANGASVYRSTVFIGSPLTLAVALGSSVIITLFFLHKEKKMWLFFAMCLQVIGILCTSSRAPLVFTVCGCLIMGILFWREGSVSNKIVKILVGIMAGAILVLVWLMCNPEFKTGIDTIDYFIYRITSMLDFTGEWGNVGRIKIWTYYIEQFKKAPFLGYGIASTSAEVLSNRLIDFGGFKQIVTESGVLARLVETGIVGTLGYYIFIGNCIWTGYISVFEKKVYMEHERILLAGIGVVALVFLEDIILQVSLDIFVVFVLMYVLAYAISLKYAQKGSIMNE